MTHDVAHAQAVLHGAEDLSRLRGLTADQVPDRVQLPGWEPWGGAGSFGSLEMDCHGMLLDQLSAVASQHGQAVFVLSSTPTSEADDTYVVSAHAGGELEPRDVPGLLVLTDTGLVLGEDAWDVFGSASFSSDSGWPEPIARR